MKQQSLDLPTDLKQAARALSRRHSIVEHVEECLRDLILSGKLKPGERIVETRIARQLGIGQPAVREALKTLEAEGLVTHQPKRGCSVITLTTAEIDQIFSLRVEWEVLAVKLAMEAGATAIKERLEELLAALEDTQAAAEQGDAAKFYHCDLEFHQTLWRLAGNLYLERALHQITVPLFAFVMIKVASRPDFDFELATEQHRKVVRAIASGDTRRAMKITREVLNGFWKQGLGVVAEQDV